MPPRPNNQVVGIHRDFLDKLKGVSDYATMSANEFSWRISPAEKAMSVSTWQRAFGRKDDGKISLEYFIRIVEYLCFTQRWDVAYFEICDPHDIQVLQNAGLHLFDCNRKALNVDLWKPEALQTLGYIPPRADAIKQTQFQVICWTTENIPLIN